MGKKYTPPFQQVGYTGTMKWIRLGVVAISLFSRFAHAEISVINSIGSVEQKNLEQTQEVHTKEDGFLQLVFSQSWTLEVGPQSHFKIQGISKQAPQVQLLHGQFRIATLKPLATAFVLSTASSKIRLKQGEFLMRTSTNESKKTTKTELLSLSGLLTVDFARPYAEGKHYVYSLALKAPQLFLAESTSGITEQFEVKTPSFAKLKNSFFELHPKIFVHASPFQAQLPLSRLYGTGVPLALHLQKSSFTPAQTRGLASFELRKPLKQRRMRSPSGNFRTPSDFFQKNLN